MFSQSKKCSPVNTLFIIDITYLFSACETMVKVEPDVLPLDLAQPQDAQRIKQLPPEANWQQVKVATQSDTVIVKNSTDDPIPSDKLGKEPFPKVDSQQVMESNTEKNSICDSNCYKTLGLIIPSEISQADPQNLEQKQQICPDVTDQNPQKTDHICKANQQSGESVKTQSQKPTSPKPRPVKPKQQATKQKQTKQKNAQKATANDSKQIQKNLYERFHSFVSALLLSVLNAVMLKCNSKIAKLLVCFLIFGSALQIVASQPIMVEFKEQIHPWQCRSHFTDTQECPHFNSEYETLNKTCCQDFGGTVLHCLSHFDTDAERYILLISCLPDSTVPAGKYLTIIPHNSLPQKVVQTCPPGHFEPKERKSSQIRHPYCQSKTPCNATEGQQILCDRGPVGQDLCMCSPGYEPKYWNTSTSLCKEGFDSNSHWHCVCNKVPCPPGTARNISYGSLADSGCQKKISIDYACINISSTVKTDTTTPSNTTPAQDQGTSGASEKSKDLSFLVFLVLILPISLVVYVWYIKSRQEVYFHHLLEAV